MSLPAKFKQVTEGRWAQRLVNALIIPAQRREQERLDLERLYVLSRLYGMNRSRQAAAGSAPADAATQLQVQHMIMQVGGTRSPGLASPLAGVSPNCPTPC